MTRFAEVPDMGAAEDDWRPASREAILLGRSQPRLPGPALTPPSGSPGPSSDKVDWLRALRILHKHWRLSATFAASVMSTVLIATVLTKPEYAPSARVEIDPPGAELFSLEDHGSTQAGADYIETQARNMQSDELLVSVIRQLHLDRISEFTQRGFITRSLGAAFSVMEKVPEWLWGERNQAERSDSNADLLVLSPSEARALRMMQKRLTVDRDSASRLVTVSFASHDPLLSATVTNAIVHSFIDRTYQTRHETIMQSTEWLAKELDDIRTKMEASNRALADFQRASGIADVDQYRSTYTDRLEELSKERTQALSDRIQIESFLGRVRSGDFQTLPQVQNNQVVQLLTQRLGEARADLAQTLAVYGKNHPNTKRIQNEVQELESQINLQRKAIVGQMETSYSAALAREHLIDSQLRSTSTEVGQMAQYTELKKEAQSNADLYNALYAKVKEAGIAAASKSINIRVVDQARVLDTPTSPQPLINLSLGLCVAIIGGILLALIREAFDHKIHTIQDVRQSIGISAVSVLPLAQGAGRSALGAFGSARGSSAQSRLVDGPTNFLLNEPGCEQSEAFRGIHTSVLLSQPGRSPRVLLIGSSLPGEGKTTVAINLAVALVRQGSTCILDADLRRPSVGRAFKVAPSHGLSDYLVHSTSFESILTSAPHIEGLTIITAGKSLTDPGSLTSSNNMRLLIRALRERYDFVIIDSPPILPYSDGRALAPFVDGVVFVSRAGVVTREEMARSMELLQEVNSAPILEVVLNGASTHDNSYGYPYKYDSTSPLS